MNMSWTDQIWVRYRVALLMMWLLTGGGLVRGQTDSDWIERARYLHHQGHSEEALALLDQEAGEHPGFEVLVLRSGIAYDLGRLDEAILSLSQALRLSSHQADLFFRRGMMWYERTQYRLAIADFDYFIGHFDPNTTAVYFQVDPWMDEQASVQTSNMLLGDAYLHRALCYEEIDSLQAAERDFVEALRLDRSPSHFLDYGLLKLRQGDTSMALTLMQEAVSIDPAYSLGWYNLIVLDPSTPLPDRLAEDPQIFPLLYYRALETVQDQEWLLAHQLVGRLLDLYPGRHESHALAGRLAYGQKDWDRAIDHFQRALALSDGPSDYRLLLANAFFKKRAYGMAVSHYELYLAADDHNTDVWFNAAVAYHRLGDDANMCRCLEQAIAGGVQNPQIIRMKSHCP